MSVAPIWTSRILDRRPFRLVPILLIAAFSWQWAMAQAAAPQSQRIIHESWTFKHGAPEGVSALAQTADGFLWLGAPAGLFRFDGVRFEPFRSPFGDQLLSTYVFALFAPPTGSARQHHGQATNGFVLRRPFPTSQLHRHQPARRRSSSSALSDMRSG